MEQRNGKAGILLLIVFVAVTTVKCQGPGGDSGQQALAASPAPDATSAEAAARCASLIGLSVPDPPDTVITTATVIPAEGIVPEYCQVQGGVETVILFELGLPSTAWNGRFFYVGGGGYNGNIPRLTHALARGYAAVGSDTGHRGEHWDASALLNDPQDQINYAYRGAHLVTVAAKEMVKAYYGEPAENSYFLGCSNGGKMGFMAAQRYPADFDGIVIGGAVVDRTKLMMSYSWTQRGLLGAEIPPYKIPAMAKATLDACDAQDGLADGVIDSPDKCDFDPAVLTCEGEDTPDCLTPAQVTAWRKILDGPTNSAGEQLFPGYSPGHEEDYEYYITGNGIQHGYPSSNFMYMDSFMRWIAFDPSFDSVRDFDMDTSPEKLKEFEKIHNTVDTDLAPFRDHGGKLIIYNGWADHSTPPIRPIEYYNAVRETLGGEIDDFSRLFMVPGFHHCSGGPGPNVFGARGSRWFKMNDPEHDVMGAIVQWVEEDVAPEKIIATKFVNDDPEQGVARQRPLCPYPQVAQYTGSGSIDEAANFVCATTTE